MPFFPQATTTVFLVRSLLQFKRVKVFQLGCRAFARLYSVFRDSEMSPHGYPGKRHHNGLFGHRKEHMEKLKMHHWTRSRGPTGIASRILEEPKIPTDMFLWFAGASILGSLFLQVKGRSENAMFVGQWVPTLLILGVYNRIVKLIGHR